MKNMLTKQVNIWILWCSWMRKEGYWKRMSRMQRRLPSNVWRRWISLTNSSCSFSVLSLDLHRLLNLWIGSWNSTDASWAKWKEGGVWADTEWSRDSLIGSSQETLFAATISWVEHCALIHLSKILKLTFVCIINVLCVCGTWTIHVHHQHTWKFSTWSARKLYDMLDWCYMSRSELGDFCAQHNG